MPRFVILQHDHPELHWDFMLEDAGVLKTWRLPAPPSERPTEATAIGDHRLAYLDYEGPVSGGRGSVQRWDAGHFEVQFRSESQWTVRLHGPRWQGIVTLVQRDGTSWSVQCESVAGA